MITLEQAKELKRGDVVHDVEVGGGHHCIRWKVNGKVKLWKRSPKRIQIPVKHGLHDYGYIYRGYLEFLHLERECPNA